jgi:hypothetical protein
VLRRLAAADVFVGLVATFLAAVDLPPEVCPVGFLAALFRDAGGLAAPGAAFSLTSLKALAAMVWNCWVKEPHSCNGSITPDAGFSAASVGAAAGFSVAAAGAFAGSALGAVAPGMGQPEAVDGVVFSGAVGIPMVKFMPLSVAIVSFCTSSAWIVAASAREFCSSQN